MDRVSLLWRLRRRARRGVLCMGLFCMTMAVLYTLCAENSVPVTDAIFGVRARTRAQPRAHTIAKVRLFAFFVCAKVHTFTAYISEAVYKIKANGNLIQFCLSHQYRCFGEQGDQNRCMWTLKNSQV